MKEFQEKLSTKRETKKGMLPYWCLHWARNQQLFEGSKIVVRQTADSIIATLDEENFYTIDSVLIIKLRTTELEYKFVLSILNSRLAKFFYRELTQEQGRVFAQVKPKNVRKMFIPCLDSKSQKFFVDAVDEILKAYSSLGTNTPFTSEAASQVASQVHEIERRINQKIYQIYSLTDEEICLIELSK